MTQPRGAFGKREGGRARRRRRLFHRSPESGGRGELGPGAGRARRKRAGPQPPPPPPPPVQPAARSGGGGGALPRLARPPSCVPAASQPVSRAGNERARGMAAAPATPAPGSGRRAPAVAASGGSSALRALAPASLLLLPAEAETRQRLLRTAKKEVSPGAGGRAAAPVGSLPACSALRSSRARPCAGLPPSLEGPRPLLQKRSCPPPGPGCRPRDQSHLRLGRPGLARLPGRRVPGGSPAGGPGMVGQVFPRKGRAL